MSKDSSGPGADALSLKVLAGIGSGLAGLTFFTFMGGAIEVARLRGAGLSGTEAVALMPKPDLLAVGAQVLALPTLIALVVVALFVPAARCPYLRGYLLTVFAFLGLVFAVALLMSAWYVGDWSGDEWFAVGALFVTAIVGALAVRSLAARAGAKGSRLAAGTLLFLVVALFVAITSYARGYASPTVHPVVVRLEHGAVEGVYIGENDKEVWVGVICPKPGDPDHGDKANGRILAVLRSDVRGMVIGAGVGLKKMDDELSDLRLSGGLVPG